MSAARRLAAAAVLVGAAAAAGCGIGAGQADEGEATLTVTRDYGGEGIVDVTVEDPAETDTVMRVLDREAQIATRYGGGFVQSIEGTSGGVREGRTVDWFFYLNGIESPVGAAEAPVRPGDRVWWDHHDWTDVMRVPAVVGSFPQPFEAAFEETGAPIEVGCGIDGPACETVLGALEQEGVEAEAVELAEADPGRRPRVLVGELDDVTADRAGRLLARGPGESGVFVRTGEGNDEIALLDERGRTRHRGELGLVAATAQGGQAPTWLITGTDADLVAGATELLGGGLLHNRFALAVGGDGETIPVPVR